MLFILVCYLSMICVILYWKYRITSDFTLLTCCKLRYQPYPLSVVIIITFSKVIILLYLNYYILLSWHVEKYWRPPRTPYQEIIWNLTNLPHVGLMGNCLAGIDVTDWLVWFWSSKKSCRTSVHGPDSVSPTYTYKILNILKGALENPAGRKFHFIFWT